MSVTTEQIQELDFGSNAGAGSSFRELDTSSSDIGGAIGLALDESPTKGLRLARGILSTTDDVAQAADEMGAMVDWAASGDDAARETVARAARLSDGGVLFVDRVSTLPAADARPMVADFLRTGGNIDDIATWLATVGAVLRRHPGATDSLGGVIDWVVDRVEDVVDAISEGVETIIDAVVDAVGSLVDLIADAVRWTVDQLTDLAAALLQAGQSIADVLAAAVQQSLAFVRRMGIALIEAGQLIADVLNQLADIAVSAVRAVVGAAIAAGHAIVDIVAWMAGAVADAVRQAIRGLLDAAGSIFALLVDVAQLGLGVMRDVVSALLEIGHTLIGLVIDLAGMALDALALLIEAAIELGLRVAELVGRLAVMAYDTVADIVTAALRAGITVLELVGEVAGVSYWAFRRIVNGIIEAAGPVGDILDAVLDSAEDFVRDAWRSALNALRFAEAQLRDALDWARARGIAAMEAVLQAWEDIGEDLIAAYQWARDVAIATGDAVFRVIGEVTVKLNNSVSYVIGYLENDFLEGLEDFAIGLLEAGYAVADLVARVVERTIEVVGAVFRGALAAGVTLTDLLINVVTEPSRVVEHVMSALDEMGQTVTDVMGAIAAAIDQLVDDVIAALLAIGTSMQTMIGAIWEIGGGLIGVAVSAILNTFGSYRPLTAAERQLAELIFGDSLDYDDIYISQDDLVNDLIFWVQDGFGEDPDSRAFVTFNLINYDVDDVLTDATLIHELTHVWQATVEGPFYMAEAIHAQLEQELGGPDAYNYGYTNSSNGDGADDALIAAGGDFSVFNPEQQGNIIEHYYVRRYEENRPAAEYAAWQPYVDVVQAA